MSNKVTKYIKQHSNFFKSNITLSSFKPFKFIYIPHDPAFSMLLHELELFRQF